eukprot:7021734-Pyramimonas_sp.AAC.2
MRLAASFAAELALLADRPPFAIESRLKLRAASPEETVKHAAVLRRCFSKRHFSEAELLKLATHMRVAHLAPGETVLLQGERPPALLGVARHGGVRHGGAAGHGGDVRLGGVRGGGVHRRARGGGGRAFVRGAGAGGGVQGADGPGGPGESAGDADGAAAARVSAEPGQRPGVPPHVRAHQALRVAAGVPEDEEANGRVAARHPPQARGGA